MAKMELLILKQKQQQQIQWKNSHISQQNLVLWVTLANLIRKLIRNNGKKGNKR